MTKHLFTFLGTFVLGALIALAGRAALFNPHGEASTQSPPASVATGAQTASSPAPDPHGNHSALGTRHSAIPKPVNTVCAICGMDVDPSLPTAEYKGQTIGFGCRMCPPKFKANPDKYGPAYLKNEVLEN